MDDSQRLLNFPALLNVRDLGGYPTTDGGRTRWRSLLRSDDLSQLTPAGVDAMVEYGVETVIDLRWAEEIALNPSPIPGQVPIRYEHVSLLAETAQAWAAICQDTRKELWKPLVLQHFHTELCTVLRLIATAAPGPLLFHCVSGKDRTGLIAALLLTVAQVEPESIARDYAQSTERLRDPYLARYPEVARAEIIERVRCPPEGAHNMLQYLADRGGVRAYLMTIGLTAGEIESLRARLRD
jgi:protein-tyrosine phosphatase